MDKKRYTLPEDKGGMAAEPAVASSTAAQDLQTLRHRIVDAVYQSHDAEKLQSCYIFLTQNDRFPEAETIEEAEDTPKIDGEKWAREVLLPIVQEVREATARGYRYPDAHELLKELEELDEQEA